MLLGCEATDAACPTASFVLSRAAAVAATRTWLTEGTEPASPEGEPVAPSPAPAHAPASTPTKRSPVPARDPRVDVRAHHPMCLCDACMAAVPDVFLPCELGVDEDVVAAPARRAPARRPAAAEVA